MGRYKYLLFDWDGCLAKTLEVWLDAHRITFAEYGVHPSDQEILRHLGDWQSPKYFGISDIEGCVRKISQEAVSSLESVELYDYAHDLLKTLKTSSHIALLSSSKRDVLIQGVQHNSLVDCFEIILAAEDVINHKPDPEIIEKALRALGGNKTDAVMIGDSRKDLGAAKNAGVDSILFYPEAHKRFYDLDELITYSPTHVVDSFQKLASLLEK